MLGLSWTLRYFFINKSRIITGDIFLWIVKMIVRLRLQEPFKLFIWGRGALVFFVMISFKPCMIVNMYSSIHVPIYIICCSICCFLSLRNMDPLRLTSTMPTVHKYIDLLIKESLFLICVIIMHNSLMSLLLWRELAIFFYHFSV